MQYTALVQLFAREATIQIFSVIHTQIYAHAQSPHALADKMDEVTPVRLRPISRHRLTREDVLTLLDDSSFESESSCSNSKGSERTVTCQTQTMGSVPILCSSHSKMLNRVALAP